ncbi:hypothetical protein Barb7_02151 [Bacteroidales bacterium Barb7]|nr:hypothetical protein Barb7_02151 [Bacteroidales bacterium Barb7]
MTCVIVEVERNTSIATAKSNKKSRKDDHATYLV